MVEGEPHLPAVDRPAARSRARRNSSSMTGRPSPTASPTTAISSPSFVKDLVPRYQTMRGKMVERRFGWDCHGLPAELHSETELKLSGRRDIIEYGVARFNEHCRDVGDAVPERLGILRQPRGALGRLRERLPHHGPLLHGEHHVGLQTALGQGADLRGLPRRPLFLGGADAALAFRDAARQFLPPAPGPGADGHLQAPSEARRDDRAEAPRLDDDALDAAVQPRARRPSRGGLRA